MWSSFRVRDKGQTLTHDLCSGSRIRVGGSAIELVLWLELSKVRGCMPSLDLDANSVFRVWGRTSLVGGFQAQLKI